MLIKKFICAYCKQEKTYKTDNTGLGMETFTRCCSDCSETPMAKRRFDTAMRKIRADHAKKDKTQYDGYFCNYCKKKSPFKESTALTEPEKYLLFFCKNCMKNPMAMQYVEMLSSRRRRNTWGK